MKKIFSIFLAIVMVFSMSAVAFAADFTDTADSKHYNAIETLHALGLVNGYDDGKTYGPNDELTRSQACVIIVRALNGEPRDYYNQIFTDVPVTHWAADYIAEAYNMGLVSGYGNNVFGPEDKVTYDQMSKIILNILGYRNTGSWPTGVRETAKMAGLYDNCVIVDGALACTRGTVAQMIYNAFDCKTLNTNGFPTGKTFLDILGFTVVAPTAQVINNKYTGHLVATYNDGIENIPTSVIVTKAYDAKFVTTNSIKIGTVVYDIDWNTTELYIDGVDSNDTMALAITNASIKAIFKNENGKAVMHAVTVTTPAVVNQYLIGAVIDENITKTLDNYVPGLSIVTQIGDEYFVSNERYTGYVVDEWDGNGYHWVKFSDGITMKFSHETHGHWNFGINRIVVIFYDYVGVPADYICY